MGIKYVTPIARIDGLSIYNKYDIIRVNKKSVTIKNNYEYGKAYDKKLFLEFTKLRFNPGDTIDIFYRNMPNRLLVRGVTLDPSLSFIWYHVILESDNSKRKVTETWILEYIRNKGQHMVYENEFVRMMYSQGFRFYGNYRRSDLDIVLHHRLKKMNCISIAESYKQAFYPNGDKCRDKESVWIKYKNIIDGGFHGYETYYDKE